jgi:hypothetical protein
MAVVSFALSIILIALPVAAQSAVPHINQPLAPMSAAPGGPSFQLMVNGTGFSSVSIVNWNGAALTTAFVNSSRLTAAVPVSAIATANTASITVSTPPPGGGTSETAFFNVSNSVTVPVFTPLPPNPTFADIHSAIVADFNGDGKLDLAYLTSAATSNVIIQMGSGDGSFQAPSAYSAGSTATSLVAGDFDGDGKLDLAVANTQDSSVSILLGNGDGTFQPQVTFPTAVAPEELVAGDLNRDGKLDLVTANRFQDTGDTGGISVLLGNGDGSFQEHVDYDQAVNAGLLTIGDFNQDGDLDLIYDAGAPIGMFSFLRGNGDGTFQPAVRFPADLSPGGLTTADVNGDAKLDLIAADGSILSPGGAFVWLGNGDGTFPSPADYDPDLIAGKLLIGDFNADGNIDLVLSDPGNELLVLLLGNGDGTFQNPSNIPTNSAALLVAGDFNGDGKMDIAVGLNDAGHTDAVVIFLQGQFPAATVSPTNLAFGQQALGTSSHSQAVVLTNTGLTALTLSNVAVAGINAADFVQSNTCGTTLAAAASCEINVTFAPLASGNRSASVSVTDNAPGSPQLIVLTGTTPPAPAVSLSASDVSFPDQYAGTAGLPITVTLTNTGTAPLTINSVAASPADFGPLSACGNSVAAGISCAVAVFFDPTVSGMRTGTLTITDNAADSPQTVSLQGIGQDFSLLPASSSSATVAPGQLANYHLSLAPSGGFNQPVGFSCEGAPEQSTCSVPSQVVLSGSNTIPVTVTVATAGRLQALSYPGGGWHTNGAWKLALVFPWLLGVVWLARPGGRHRRQRHSKSGWSLALVCLLSAGITLTACGGSAKTNVNPGTPAGNYKLNVRGTFISGSTTLTHSIQLTLVVQ